MNKQKRQILILGLALLILGVAFFLLQRQAPTAEETADSETETVAKYEITYISADLIDRFVMENEEGTLEFVKKDGEWVYAADPSVRLGSGAVSRKVNSVRILKGNDCVENVEDLSQYGLDPAKIRVTISGSDLEPITVCIGDLNASVNKCYLCLEGENTVYTFGTSILDEFDGGLEEMLESESD